MSQGAMNGGATVLSVRAVAIFLRWQDSYRFTRNSSQSTLVAAIDIALFDGLDYIHN